MEKKQKTPMSRTKGWAILLSFPLLYYLFAVRIGPWLQSHIQGAEQIAGVVEEYNINAGAYYYTEVEEFAQAQAYLSQSLQTMAPEHYGLTLPFLSGIALCLLILYFGMRALPR